MGSTGELVLSENDAADELVTSSSSSLSRSSDAEEDREDEFDPNPRREIGLPRSAILCTLLRPTSASTVWRGDTVPELAPDVDREREPTGRDCGKGTVPGLGG